MLACGPGAERPEEPARAEGASGTPASAVSSRVPEDPSGWSCQRYGDVTDEAGDSYDSQAAERAERYLVETVSTALRERGLEVEPDQLDRGRMVGLLSEICMEAPDLLLEVATPRVVDGLL
jgi:hypothetical protein